MGINLTLWSPTYAYLGALAYEEVSLGQREGKVGTGGAKTLRGLPASAFVRDAIVVATYSEIGLPDQRSLWFVRRPRSTVVSRTETVECGLVDANDILRRRIVAYASGSAQAQKNMQAAAMLVEMVREQFTTAADTTRNAALVVPDAPVYGSTQQQAFAHDNLLDALRQVCLAETQRGNWMSFDVAPANFDGQGIAGLGLTFSVLAGQRGRDLRDRVHLSAAAGNLTNVRTETDYREEATRVYAGGSGQGAARLVASSTRADYAELGPFGLIEDWHDATNVSTATYLTARAEAELQERAARTTYSAEIVFGSALRWGRDIGYGDMVSVEVAGQLVDGRVDAYGMSANPDDGTVVEAVVEGYL